MHAAGSQGGTVLVPAGDFVIGPIELKSDVTLHLSAGATLVATTDISQYHPARGIPLQGDHTMGDGNTGLVYAANAENVTIEGKGTIDGQGTLVRGGGLGGNKRCHLALFYHWQESDDQECVHVSQLLPHVPDMQLQLRQHRRNPDFQPGGGE